MIIHPNSNRYSVLFDLEDEPLTKPKKYKPIRKDVSPQNEKICRICLCEKGKLVSPCNCSGTMKYVHLDCLNKWRRSASSSKSPIYTTCPSCGVNYKTKCQPIKGSEEPAPLKQKVELIFVLCCYMILIPLYILEELYVWGVLKNEPIWLTSGIRIFDVILIVGLTVFMTLRLRE